MLAERLFPLKATLVTGVRKIKEQEVTTIDINTEGSGKLSIELVEQSVKLVLDQKTTFFLIYALLGVISPLVLADLKVMDTSVRKLLKARVDLLYDKSAEGEQ